MRIMSMNRRDFIHIAALGTGAAAVGASGCERTQVAAGQTRESGPPSIQALKPMTAGIVPIADDERRARIAKAQQLMAEQKIDAIFMEGTASCFYFANMRWGQSERTFGLVIPAKGRARVRLPEVRGGPRARADQVRQRSPHLGGGREPVHADRRHRAGSRRAAPPHRHGRARAVLHR